MGELVVCELNAATWPAYEALLVKHNGIWGGCWCMEFQRKRAEKYATVDAKIQDKRELVAAGEARAALVFDGETAVGWCQFGRGHDLTAKRKFKRHYEKDLVTEPDWRITCFFVDRHNRGRGIANLALDGALAAIAREGGGLVEAYPESIEGRKVKGTFIYLGTVPMFERRGFAPQRQVAMHHWVMTKVVEPDPS
ncbi:MAG: GNAT family N-acetyltransferase [Armatimonadetes bacterium]|nr:GNAT family N-acetyltransferase [Armatimonadota bacterium]